MVLNEKSLMKAFILTLNLTGDFVMANPPFNVDKVDAKKVLS